MTISTVTDRERELSAQVDKLTTALAECRDAFPAPPAGGYAEAEWASAMSGPEYVADYVRKMAQKPAQPEQGYTTTRNAWTGKATHRCNVCRRDDFRSEHAAKFHTCEALAERSAQPQQELVKVGRITDNIKGMVLRQEVMLYTDDYLPIGTALYTSSPQRKPLTYEEIDKAWRSCDYTVPWKQHRIDIARAIEAAHGIKEQP